MERSLKLALVLEKWSLAWQLGGDLKDYVNYKVEVLLMLLDQEVTNPSAAILAFNKAKSHLENLYEFHADADYYKTILLANLDLLKEIDQYFIEELRVKQEVRDYFSSDGNPGEGSK